MKGARVNGRWSVLDLPLQNGDIVEIITSNNSHPSLDWLNFVVTPSARNRIRQWYKRSHRDENVARGRDLLEKELGKNGFEALLKSDPMQTAAERCNYQCPEDLLAALGYGEVTLNHVVNRLRDAVKALQPLEAVEEVTPESLATSSRPVRNATSTRESCSPIAGVEGLLYNMAGCCNPLPGEPIIGVVTRSKGISIHRHGCPNAESVEGDRLVPVSWNATPNSGRTPTYLVNLQIEVLDRVGVFKDILARLSDQNINVCNAGVKTSKGKPALIDLGIQVRDRSQLELISIQIRKMSDVLNIRRVSEVNEQTIR